MRAASAIVPTFGHSIVTEFENVETNLDTAGMTARATKARGLRNAP